MKKVYRIVTFSNNVFVPQKKVLFFWAGMGEVFEDRGDAVNFIATHKLMSMKPTVVDISYID